MTQRLSRLVRLSPKARAHLWLWLCWFALYTLTTARDVLPADSGEFQLAAAGWGILHPPGYPLYTIMGALWVRLLPWGGLPFRLNLLSAALAATTLVLVTETIRTWARALGYPRRAAYLGGLTAALLLGAASTFWAQATTANIRMPTLAFAAWGFLALARYTAAATPQQQRRALMQLALALGLGVGHHPSLVFVALGWALYLLLFDARLFIQPQRWWDAALVAALAWGLPQLYLPLRGAMRDVPLAPGGLNTWQGFWHHVLAQGFAGDMLAFATLPDLAQRLPLLRDLFGLQFAPSYLLLMALSALWLARRDGRLATALLFSWGIHTFITITYRAPQTIEYLMPAYLPPVIALGLGVAALIARPGPHWIGYAVLLTALCGAPLRVDAFLTLAADTTIRERTAPLLALAPADALILADWHWATPLWVLQEVEGLQPDAEVAYVYPEPPLRYEEVWWQRAEAAGERPLFATHSYDWADWTFAPVAGGFRLYRRPLTVLPTALDYIPLEADLGPVRLLGYRLTGPLTPGSTVELTLAWQAHGPQEPPPSFAGRLWSADGALLAASDQFLSSDTALGEVRFARLIFLLPFDQCPAHIQPSVGVYTVMDGAFQDLGQAALPAVIPTCDYPTLPTARPHPGVVLGRGPWLHGYDYDYRGEISTLYLHWCGPGAAVWVSAGESRARVERLAVGQCQSVALDVPSNNRPALHLARDDGRTARLLTLPLATPQSDAVYIPFGDRMVLTGATQAERGGQQQIILTWRITRPLVDDYGVSVRLVAADGSEIARHDGQPGLGALPTLKWLMPGRALRDPHPFTLSTPPAALHVVVYENFQLTPLPSTHSTMAQPALAP